MSPARRAPAGAGLAALAMAASLAAACDDLQGLGGQAPPLATFAVAARGAPAAGEADVHVALVWGAQWLTEPLCVLPPESPEAAAVLAAGCRDPFGFVPARVAAAAPLSADGTAALSLASLPGADVLVGDLTARVAYGSVVLFDDRDHDGALTLGRPNRLGGPGGRGGPTDPSPTRPRDVVLGASFTSMTRPDERVAFREGAFAPAAFYPRAGCGAPPPGFSVLAAGGFSAEDALAATLAGRLPAEDPATCAERAPADAPIVVEAAPASAAAAVAAVACREPIEDASVRWREPQPDAPDLARRTYACVHLARFGGPPSDTIQLVVTGRDDEPCRGLTHYVLRGCREDPDCAVPDWDHAAAPPAWWPCR